ncbi:hypothetical protein GRX01_04595 [Halobaculum sp. WSA2]|uniref:Uncharacterized protein n=1 Tax=Halobaculum saliterrae TaxID=2073113 RepID=A0A6B0SSQ7_9EURY|nr:hypothetical protein [Halobaculum saliterrae]MXR40626.1 hypothetical protein [Halobaculum saliterrae]
MDDAGSDSEEWGDSPADEDSDAWGDRAGDGSADPGSEPVDVPGAADVSDEPDATATEEVAQDDGTPDETAHADADGSETDPAEEATVPDRYVQVDAFDMPEVAAADAGPGVIAVATADGRIDLITSGDRRRVTRRDGVIDVAVADRVYALTDTELEAFSHAGSRVWGVDVTDGRSVDADPEDDRVYVRTGDGEFVVLEGRTGIEAGRFDQPNAEVAESPAVAAADGRLAVASWSFLTVLDSSGDLLDEQTLSGAVTDVGLLPGRAVVSLKDGQLVGYEGDERLWGVDGDVSWLADAGIAALAARVAGSDYAVDTDGDRRPLDGVSGTPIAATPALDLVCTVGSGTATVYAAVGQGDESVGVRIESESVRPADPTVVLALTNEGDRAVEVDATVESEGAEVASSTVSATIDADATQRRRVSLQNLSAEEVTVAATAGEASVERTLEVQEETTALRVDAVLDGVENGVLSAAIEVENEGESSVTGVTVGERTVGTLDPGEAERVPFEQDLPSGAVAVRADGVDPLEAGTAVPTTPTAIDLEAESDGFLSVTLRNETPVAVDDEVTVEGVPDEDGSFSMPVSIPANGAYRLALPVASPGERSVTVETSGGRVSERLSLARCSLLGEPATGGDAGRTGAGGDGRGATRSRGRSSTGSRPVAGGDEAVPVSMDRQFPSEPPRRGVVFEERLVVSNESAEPVEFELRTDDGAYAQRLKVRGSGQAVGTRYHVPLESTLSLPRVELEHEGGVASLPETDLSVDDGGLVATITWRRDDARDGGELSLSLESDEGTWEVEDAVVGGERSAPIDARVGPDSPAQVTVTTPYTLRDEVGKAFVRARRVDSRAAEGDVQQINTLVVHESVTDGDDDRVDDLSVEVESDSRVERGFGSVFLSITNDGSRPVAGVSVDADGSHVEKAMYADGDDGETIAPGSSLRYLVDLEGVEAGEEVVVDAEVTAGEAATHATVSAVADEDGAVESGDWTLDVETDESGGPSRLSTQYE